MQRAESDLDFTVIDRARSLGELLKLLFALLGAFRPKDVADLLTKFDPSVIIDPETVGRWLRNERRPSKEHLELIVRLLQARSLMGKLRARDHLFMRIATFYIKLGEAKIGRVLPGKSVGRNRPSTRPWRSPTRMQGNRALGSRDGYDLALALHLDLKSSGSGTPRFDAQCVKRLRNAFRSPRRF